MIKINIMRDQINDKLKELNVKEVKIESREKMFYDQYKCLSNNQKEIYKKLEEEFLKQRPNEMQSVEEPIKDLNFDSIIKEIRNSLSNLNKRKLSASMDNIFFLKKDKREVIEIKENNKISSKIKDTLINNSMHINNLNNKFIKEHISVNVIKHDSVEYQDINIAKEEGSKIYLSNDKNLHKNNIDNIVSLENISHIHDSDMLNNRESLLTDGINLTLTQNISKIKNNVDNIESRTKKSKSSTKNLKNHNNKTYVDTSQNKIYNPSRSMTEIETHHHRKTTNNNKLSHNDSSTNFLNSGLVLEGVKTNRTFYLIRQKRMEQMLNSSLDVYADDLGGNNACTKLRRNYDVDITRTNQRHACLHSSKERSLSLSNNSSDPKLTKVSKEKLRDTFTVENTSVIMEESRQYSKYDLPYKRLHTNNDNIHTITANDSVKNLNTDCNRPKINNSAKYAHIQPRYNKTFQIPVEKPNEKVIKSDKSKN
jgi:hypothetical protein